jgi:hypothetical protein
MLTIEVARNIISNYNLGFTDDFILRRIESRELKRVPKPYKRIWNSSYGFGVCAESVAELLRSQGIPEKEIIKALPL